ncbi:MAG: LysR substrate-binding domain-containing protein [Sporolactobacillus sp.]
MNIRDLEYYRKLFHVKNYTRVASHFNISQPTVTAAIQRLERELDTQLLIRDQSHKDLIFTESGIQFEKHVEQILQELETADSEIKAIKKEKVRFGIPPIIGSYYFPLLSEYLLKDQSLSSLVVYEDGSKSLLHRLLKGELDLALLGTAQMIAEMNDSLLTAQILAHKKFKIIVSAQHPFAKRESISFKDLEGENFIQLNERFVHPLAFNRLCQQAHIRPKVINRLNDIQIIKGMVARNVGISLLTEMAIMPQDPVVSIPLNDEKQPEFLVSIAYQANHVLTDLQQKLIHWFSLNSM